ncbi:MAG: hypothetical protein GF368_03200 [Candidatus Aenigmarchaeota archaeon]|nr:hypothetical protein [Candidatus Aenigmarchaeota archaeon]
MRPKYHFIFSIIISVIFFFITGSLFSSLVCFLVGFFTDLDHFLDYLIVNKKIPFGKDFFDYFYEARFRKIYLFLHSVELIPVIYFLGNIFLDRIMVYAILTGFITHLAFDYIKNTQNPLSYFLIYRILVNFDAIKVLGFDFTSEEKD